MPLCSTYFKSISTSFQKVFGVTGHSFQTTRTLECTYLYKKMCFRHQASFSFLMEDYEQNITKLDSKIFIEKNQ